MAERHRRRDPLHHLARRLGGRARRDERLPELATPEDWGARIAGLERELQEVRTRINALFFAVLAAAIGEIVGRAVLG